MTSSNANGATASGKKTVPGLAIIANVMTPYRANLHRLLAAGVPEFKLHSLITHGVGDFDFRVQVPPEINAVNFSTPGEHAGDNPMRRPYAEWQKARRMIRYLQECNAQAVIFCAYRYLPYLLAMRYCHRAKIPFFVNNDSNIRSEPALSFIQRTIKRRMYAWWIKRASGVFSMGEFGDQFFLKYGADPKRLYRLPYWPDYDAYATVDPRALDRFRRRFGLDSQRRRIIFSGRLIPVKRVDLLIDAFAEMAARRPHWDVLIAGDGALADQLHRRVPEALRSRVNWTGFIDEADLALAYHSSDVLVLPSDREPWALVVQEAMAAGLAVVASDVVGAARELVHDGQNGKIFPAGNLAALKQSLLEVTDPSLLPKLKTQSLATLASWRQAVDPVKNVRRALTDAGALPFDDMSKRTTKAR